MLRPGDRMIVLGSPIIFAQNGFFDRRVSEIASGDDMRNKRAGFAAGFAALRQVDFDEVCATRRRTYKTG